MNRWWQIGKYVVADFGTAALAWFLFNLFRYNHLVVFREVSTLGEYLCYPHVLLGQVGIPFFWWVVYYFSGYYNLPVSRSRLNELWLTLISSFAGVLVLFFTLIINETPFAYQTYYQFIMVLFGTHFGLTYLVRLWITTHFLDSLKRGKVFQRVVIFGTGARALSIAGQLQAVGYRVVGYVPVGEKEKEAVPRELVWHEKASVPELIQQGAIDELIVATEDLDSIALSQFLYTLYIYKKPIKVWMDKQSVPFSKIRLQAVNGVPLAAITENNFSPAEQNIKLFADRVVSASMLLLLSPLYLYIAWRVKRDSPGPIIYKQERIGLHGRPFLIYKFRTMYVGSEEKGPMLSREDDERITPFGLVMRKYRLDELPQFWNVLKGDMSLVGPRPERKYFIDQIVQKAPYYYLLHNVRPGITSLGMVKYGYAGTVDQMIARLEYDIVYYENMSLALDIAILVYTVKTVLTGKGV